MQTSDIIGRYIFAGIVAVFASVVVWQIKRHRRWNLIERNRWESEKEACSKTLKGKSFCVAIRRHDGSRTTIESLLIDMLVERGGIVRNVPHELSKTIWKSLELGFDVRVDYLIIGTCWRKSDDTANHYYNLDLKVLASGENLIIGSKSVQSTSEETLASDSCIELCEVLERQQRVAA